MCIYHLQNVCDVCKKFSLFPSYLAHPYQHQHVPTVSHIVMGEAVVGETVVGETVVGETEIGEMEMFVILIRTIDAFSTKMYRCLLLMCFLRTVARRRRRR
jgi:hypothetical protein